jgi:hypothetical protein
MSCRTGTRTLEPVGETQALAKLIEQGNLDVALREETDELPLEVRYPPMLVGHAGVGAHGGGLVQRQPIVIPRSTWGR